MTSVKASCRQPAQYVGKWSTIINITAVTSVEQINRADNSTFKEDGRGFVIILYFQVHPSFITNIYFHYQQYKSRDKYKQT